nr:alpha/beta hydrolase [Lentibacillus persicus]
METSDASCRMIANRTGTIVVSVDYRLSPEYKFPTPLHDAYAALEWIYENAAPLNGNAFKIIVGGDSAGGNLATVVSMMARDQNGPQVSRQVLIYPVADLSYDTASYEEFQQGFGLDKDLMIWFGNHYIRDKSDQKKYICSTFISRRLKQSASSYRHHSGM